MTSECQEGLLIKLKTVAAYSGWVPATAASEIYRLPRFFDVSAGSRYPDAEIFDVKPAVRVKISTCA